MTLAPLAKPAIHEPYTGLANEPLEDFMPYEDVDDGNEHHAHIVRPLENAHLNLPDTATGQDVVDTARMLGIAIKALCGYEFVPKRNPEKYDACQTCMDIATNGLSGF